MSVFESLNKIQTELKAPKNLRNTFGNYNYRNAEGICEAVKPYLKEEKCILYLDDEVIQVSDRIYVKATATIMKDNETISASAYARESMTKKGMDDSQITGTASSYARKYALNGLFLLDDTKDTDSNEYHVEAKKKKEKYDKENPTLTEPMIITIQKELERTGMTEERFLQNVGIEKLEDISGVTYASIMNRFKKTKDKL